MISYILKNLILISLLLFTSVLKSQNFSISGKINYLVDDRNFDVEGISLDILNIHDSTISSCYIDTSSKFYFHNLITGNYKIRLSKPWNSFYGNILDTTILVNQNIQNINLNLHITCQKINSEKALKNISNNRPFLLLVGSIAPIIRTTDKEFESKYNLTFNDFGCTPADINECLISYNFEIFKYLDKKYGLEWRKEVRDDVIGLKFYLKHNK